MRERVIGEKRTSAPLILTFFLFAITLLIAWLAMYDRHWALLVASLPFLILSGAFIIYDLIIPRNLVTVINEKKISLAFPRRNIIMEDIEQVYAVREKSLIKRLLYGNTLIYVLKDGTQMKQKHVRDTKNVARKIMLMIQ